MCKHYEKEKPPFGNVMRSVVTRAAVGLLSHSTKRNTNAGLFFLHVFQNRGAYCRKMPWSVVAHIESN